MGSNEFPYLRDLSIEDDWILMIFLFYKQFILMNSYSYIFFHLFHCTWIYMAMLILQNNRNTFIVKKNAKNNKLFACTKAKMCSSCNEIYEA